MQFLVEKHDSHPEPSTPESATISRPVISSFYFNKSPSGSPRPGLIAGYHSLAVRDLPDNPRDDVELIFTSHGVFGRGTGELVVPEEGKESVSAGKEAFGGSWSGVLLREVHEAYSRFLLHCAVLRLRSGREL